MARRRGDRARARRGRRCCRRRWRACSGSATPGGCAWCSPTTAAPTARATSPGALAAGAPVPLTVVAVPPRPAGWAGKVWAQSAALAGTGEAPWLLLTDADIVHPPDGVARLVAAALDQRRDLVSLMARLRIRTGWERLIVPAFVYFFAQLYPFRWVASGRTAAAAGGCVLVRRAALERAGGFAAVRDAVIDDVAVARVVAPRRRAAVARPGRRGAQRPPLPPAGRPLGHGRAQRLHAAPALPARAGRHRRRPPADLRRAAGHLRGRAGDRSPGGGGRRRGSAGC